MPYVVIYIYAGHTLRLRVAKINGLRLGHLWASDDQEVKATEVYMTKKSFTSLLPL